MLDLYILLLGLGSFKIQSASKCIWIPSHCCPLARAEIFCAKKVEVDPVDRGVKPQPKLLQVTLGKETSSNSIRLDLSDVAWHNSSSKFGPWLLSSERQAVQFLLGYQMNVPPVSIAEVWWSVTSLAEVIKPPRSATAPWGDAGRWMQFLAATFWAWGPSSGTKLGRYGEIFCDNLSCIYYKKSGLSLARLQPDAELENVS